MRFALINERMALSAAYLLQMSGNPLAVEAGERLLRALMPAGQNEAMKELYDRRQASLARHNGAQPA